MMTIKTTDSRATLRFSLKHKRETWEKILFTLFDALEAITQCDETKTDEIEKER